MDRIITVDLNIAMIAKECFIKFIKLILDGPKYLAPLMDGDDDLSFSSFAKAPEKLHHVDLSFINFSTVDLGRQV